MASTVGKKFGNEVAHQLNETLNRKRWELVLAKINTSMSGIQKLRDGAKILRDGSAKLNAGNQLLKEKMGDLAHGLAQLKVGAERLREGQHQMKTQSEAIPFFGKRVSDGAEKLEQGITLLEAGLSRASLGSEQLLLGADNLLAGSTRLSGGLNLLYDKIPTEVESLEGDAEGLAASVQPINASLSPVPNNGAAFTPYFMALSLWVGVVVTTFLLQFRLQLESNEGSNQFQKLVSKLTLPGVIVFFQACFLTLTVRWGLGLDPVHPWRLWFTAIGTSFCFLLIMMALISILGDSGKLIALMLLIFQLASAGGAFPIELAGGFYSKAHPFLPLTNSVKAFRVAFFGAYQDSWNMYLARLLLIGLAAFILSVALGRRWKYVPESQFRPAIDI